MSFRWILPSLISGFLYAYAPCQMQIKTGVFDTSIMEAVVFNLRNPIFRDGRVRRALGLAFFREDLYKRVLCNNVIPSFNVIHPGSIFFSKSQDLLDYF